MYTPEQFAYNQLYYINMYLLFNIDFHNLHISITQSDMVAVAKENACRTISDIQLWGDFIQSEISLFQEIIFRSAMQFNNMSS